MFTNMKRGFRFLIGFAIVLVVAITGFAIIIQAATTWGATPLRWLRACQGMNSSPLRW